MIVAEVTSTIRDIPQEVSLAGDEGRPQPSVANRDNLHVVAKSLLSNRIGALARRRENEVKRALGYALDCPELKVL